MTDIQLSPTKQFRWPLWLVICVALVLLLVPRALSTAATAVGPPLDNLQPAEGEHPLQPLIRWGRQGIPALQQLSDYTATLVSRERLQGKLRRRRAMRLKIRHQPFSVYAGVVDGQGNVRQEAVYVEGEHHDRVWVHSDDHRWLGTIALQPESPWAKRDSKYPITAAGLHALLQRIVLDAELELKSRNLEVKIYRDAEIEGRPCLCAAVTQQDRRPDDTFYHARIFIDREYCVPVRFESYSWPPDSDKGPRLAEEFTYLNLQFNVGLSDADFDIRNNAYAFPPRRRREPMAVAGERRGEAAAAHAIQDQADAQQPLTAMPKRHSLAVQMIRTALSELQARGGYVCRMTYREPGGIPSRLRELLMRVRHEPLSIHLTELGAEGREVAFVSGAYNDRVLVRRQSSGNAATRVFRLFSHSRMVTTPSGQPLTALHVWAQLERELGTHEAALLSGTADVRFYRPAQVDGRRCTCLELASPHPTIATTLQVSRIFFDDEWRVPIRFEQQTRSSRQTEQLELLSATTYREIEWRDNLRSSDFQLSE